MHTRTVFFVSDGTGITAETFGNAILAQFEFKPRHVRLPFIDTVEKVSVKTITYTWDKMNSYSYDQQPADLKISVTLRAAPEKVYRAFFNREAMANWL